VPSGDEGLAVVPSGDEGLVCVPPAGLVWSVGGGFEGGSAGAPPPAPCGFAQAAKSSTRALADTSKLLRFMGHFFRGADGGSPCASRGSLLIRDGTITSGSRGRSAQRPVQGFGTGCEGART